MNVTDSFRHLCKTGAISVQVFGQKSKGFFSIREALRDRECACGLAALEAEHAREERDHARAEPPDEQHPRHDSDVPGD